MSAPTSARQARRKFDPVRYAPTWLIGYLGWGPRRIDATLANARNEGYSEEIIRQAAEVVGVRQVGIDGQPGWVNPEHIPPRPKAQYHSEQWYEVLLELPIAGRKQWVTWKYEWDGSKWTKVPHRTRNPRY